MVLLNKRAENNGKMCQKLTKFDSHKLTNNWFSYWLWH